MKNRLTLLFIFISQFTICQLDYIELPEHNKESYNILHVYEDGTIIASTELSVALYISQNLGKSWNEIDVSNFDNKDLQFHMNSKGQYYISKKYWIYEINVEDLKTSQLISFWPSEIEDFTFLSNGNLLIACRDSLNLYDDKLTLIKSHTWQIKNIDLITEKNSKNYIAYSNLGLDEILEFDDDLSSLNVTASESYLHNNNPVYLSNNRLFMRSGYSDDGGASITNYSIPNNQYINQHYSKDNRVLLLIHNIVYISNDFGESFELIKEITSEEVENVFLHSDTGLIYIDKVLDKSTLTQAWIMDQQLVNLTLL